MKGYNGWKRLTALLLATALIFTNAGTSTNVALADSMETAEFTVSGKAFMDAVDEMIAQGGNPITQDSLDFTNGKTEKYEALFFQDGDGRLLHECYPEYEGQSTEVEVRTFIRLPEDVSEGYTVTGEEEVILLYVNNSDDTVSCSTTVTVEGKKDRHTRKVVVRSYELAFGDEEYEITSTDRSERIDSSAVMDTVTDKKTDSANAGDSAGAGNDGQAGDAEPDKGGADSAEPDKGGAGADSAETEKGGVGADSAEPEKGEAGADSAETEKGGAGADSAESDEGGVGADSAESNKGGAGADSAEPNKGGAGVDSADSEKGGAGADSTEPEKGGAGADGAEPDKGGVGADSAEPDKGGVGADSADQDKSGAGAERADQYKSGADTVSTNRENNGKKSGDAAALVLAGQSQELQAARSLHSVPVVASTMPAPDESAAPETREEPEDEGEKLQDSKDKASDNKQEIADNVNGTKSAGTDKPENPTSSDTDKPEPPTPEDADEMQTDAAEESSVRTEETTGPETTSQETTSPETTGPETTSPETTGQEPASQETQGTAASTEGQTTAEGTVPAETGARPATPSQAEPNKVQPAGVSDLVGLDGCSTAKAYTTTLNKLRVLDDIEGYKVAYEIAPEAGACIVDAVRDAQEGEDVRFGVKVFTGYSIDAVTVDEEVMEADGTEGNISWYTVTEISGDCNISVDLTETSAHPAFSQVLRMEDGMDITITAGESVLPAGVEASAEIVTSEKESLVEAEAAREGRTVIAAPLYDINLWLDGEKLDNESWNRNGSVQVKFSGELMEQISHDADRVEVLWIKDKAEGANPMVEAVEGTRIETEVGESVPDLTWDAKHFTTYGPVAYGEMQQEHRSFNIEDLMNEGMPGLDFVDTDGAPLEVLITDKTVTLPDGKPLPRNVQFRFELSYGLENSDDWEIRDYQVQKGDTFTYKYPSWLSVSTEGFDVTRTIDGVSAVVGRAVIEDGQLTITVTADDIGKGFNGMAGVYGTLDWENVQEEQGKVNIHTGDLDYILSFPYEEKKIYDLTVEKKYKDGPFADNAAQTEGQGDVRYDESTGFPSGIRYHVTIKAGENNSGPLTNLAIKDTIANNYNQKITFDADRPVTITSNSMAQDEENSVVAAVFDKNYNGRANNIAIYLLDGDDKNASLLKGQEIGLSYWVKIAPEIWSGNTDKVNEGSYTASTTVSFKNSISVKSKESDEKTSNSTFNKTYEWFTKSGEIVTDENGKTAIRYQVFVNPDAADMSGWTVKDTLSGRQEYVGDVTLYAYDSESAYQKEETPDKHTFEANADKNGKLMDWTFTIRKTEGLKDGKGFYLFEYCATPEEEIDDDLHNKLELIPPAGSGIGSIGGGSISIKYNTYALTKENMSTTMSPSSPGNASGSTIGWEKEFGSIRWKSTILGYAQGKDSGAFIPAGSVYTDTLAVKNGSTGGNMTGKYQYHTFRDETALAENLSIADKDGKIDSSAYELKLSSDKRTFTVKFLKRLPAPLTIEYLSYVNDFQSMDNTDIRFYNTAEYQYGTVFKRTAQASQPFRRYDYLYKEVNENKSEDGVIAWNLTINQGYGGSKNIELEGRQVNIAESIPKGTVLKSISLMKNGKEILLTEGVEYSLDTQDGQVLANISLNEISKLHQVRMDKKQILVVRTSITDPAVKTFTNTAQMFIDGMALQKASVDKTVKDLFLVKGMKYNVETLPYIRYTLSVNTAGADISNLAEGTLTVEDELGSAAMSYVPGSFTVINSKTKEPIEANIAVTANRFTISGLPDETPLEIAYDVSLSGNIGDRIDTSNSASLIYGNNDKIVTEVKKQVTIIKPLATGDGYPYVMIDKVDQNAQPLTGAEFTLYPAAKEEGIWTVNRDNPVGTFSPDMGGRNHPERARVSVSGMKTGGIYYLEETKVPDGYRQSDGIYFVIRGDNAVTDMPEGTRIVDLGYVFTVENTKDSGNLELNKKVEGKSGLERTFYFTIRDENGYYYDGAGRGTPDRKTVSIDYSSGSGENGITVRNLPIGTYSVQEVLDEKGTAITEDNFYYTVKAGDEDGVSTDVIIGTEAAAEVTFINTYDALGSLTLTGTKNLKGRTLAEGEFTFGVYEGDELAAAGKNRADGTIVFDEIAYKLKDVGEHTYTVSERNGSLSGVTYDRTVFTVRVLVTDKDDRTVEVSVLGIAADGQTQADGIIFNNSYETPVAPPGEEDDGGSGGGNGSSGGSGGGGSTTGGGRYQPSTGGPGENITITPEDVPLAQMPDIPQITLLDEDVPLAPLPKTGDRIGHSFAVLIGSVMAGIYMSLRKKRHE